MHLWRCGILDRIQISVGRCCGCILFRFVFIFIFIRVLVFIFLSLPFVVFSFTLFFGGGKKKFYYCAMEMRSAILLSFSFGWVFLHFLFAAGWIFLKFFFCILSKKHAAIKFQLCLRDWKTIFHGGEHEKLYRDDSENFCFFALFIFAWKVWKAKEKQQKIKKIAEHTQKLLFLLAARGRLKRYCIACSNCQHVENSGGLNEENLVFPLILYIFMGSQ